MQTEDIFAGEDIAEVRSGNFDSDGDGVPFVSGDYGASGIAGGRGLCLSSLNTI
jgi:hypothetical protein